uniref:Protein FAR1-RELATED SEQUENCE 5 n=1 Tax=Talaromyces marneffei PM1 TaxID=1077442 RepID=A0A093VCL6_TALMA
MEQVPTLISPLDTTDSILTSTVNVLEGFSSDILPPEGDFNSRKAVFDYVNSWAKPRGYTFTTGKSSKTSNGRVKVFFAYDRNKPPPSPSSNRKHRTSSQRTNCLFSVVAKESLDGTTWALRHRPDAKFCEYNYPPSTEPSVHRAHRRLLDEEVNIIADLTTAGVPPREIRTYIRQTSNALTTQQDVYNLAASTRRKLVQGQSSIQALVNQLNDEGFWSRIQLDAANRLTAIFFAHPDSVVYLQQNLDILILDCTYKTNKYGLPLLDMIGVDCY